MGSISYSLTALNLGSQGPNGRAGKLRDRSAICIRAGSDRCAVRLEYGLGRDGDLSVLGYLGWEIVVALAGPGELLTALDVLENALGSRPTPEQLRKLTIPELDELSGLLGELSEAQCDDEIPGGASLRVRVS